MFICQNILFKTNHFGNNILTNIIEAAFSLYCSLTVPQNEVRTKATSQVPFPVQNQMRPFLLIASRCVTGEIDKMALANEGL